MVNPFRYRGYYYDVETGLYYLQSRYYDAEVGRFINRDDSNQIDLSNHTVASNYFAYCINNPVMYKDLYGEAFFTVLLIGAIVGAAISGVSKVISNKKAGKKWYEDLAISMLAGGIGGAIACISIPGISSWVCATVFGATGNLFAKLILGEINSIQDLSSAILAGAVAGIIGNASAKLLSKCVTKHFSSLTKTNQKKFLSSIGRITNRQLHEIRNQANRKLTQELIDKLVKKYGYDVLVSAWVSSTITELA